MVKEKPFRNPNTRRPLRRIPRGVRGPGRGPGPHRDLGGEDKPDDPPEGNPGNQDVRDRDADDVMQYAREKNLWNPNRSEERKWNKAWWGRS